MAENTDYYKDLVTKQQDLLYTLINPNKATNSTTAAGVSENVKFKKRFAEFPKSIAHH